MSNEGWAHVVKRHFDPSKNASQFTITQEELRKLLGSKEVVKSPILRTVQSKDGLLYLREVTLDKAIGLDKYSSYNPTSIMSILTDGKGVLKTATPGRINQ